MFIKIIVWWDEDLDFDRLLGVIETTPDGEILSADLWSNTKQYNLGNIPVFDIILLGRISILTLRPITFKNTD